MNTLTLAEQAEYDRIMAKVQNLEELGGPDIRAYSRILEAVILDLQQRLATALATRSAERTSEEQR